MSCHQQTNRHFSRRRNGFGVLIVSNHFSLRLQQMLVTAVVIITATITSTVCCFQQNHIHNSRVSVIPNNRYQQQQICSFLVPRSKAVEESLTTTSIAATSMNNDDGTVTITSASTTLSPWENWCMDVLEVRYQEALQIKCPFFRRRAADILDSMDMILRFLMIRHKSLEIILPPPAGWVMRDTKNRIINNNEKLVNLSMQEMKDILYNDWRTDTNKGYYITGKLTSSIFRDDCFFDGPDPDMPVRGLRKYLNAASQLFEHKSSSAQLLSLDIVEPSVAADCESQVIVAKWKMSGVLRLPWKPMVPEIHGTTTYHMDNATGLIYKHVETWDESVLQAFLQTFWPEMSQTIRWK